MFHFELIFVNSIRKILIWVLYVFQSTFFCMWISGCSRTICWKDVFSSLYCSCIKAQLTIFMWLYFWALYSVPWTCVSILLQLTLSWLLLSCSISSSWAVSGLQFYSSSFDTELGILGLLPLCINFRVSLLISTTFLARIWLRLYWTCRPSFEELASEQY